MDIRPENITLIELLSRQNPIQVPPYQRDYAWDENEVLDFVSDISNLYRLHYEKQKRVHPLKRHFFGSIVCAEKPLTGTGNYYEIIDGQQRLATIFLLIQKIIEGYALIADRASNTRPKKVNVANLAKTKISTASKLLFYNKKTDGRNQKTLKLTLNNADDSVFRAIIENNAYTTDRESHKRLETAAKMLDTELIQNIVNNKKDSYDTKLRKLEKLQNGILRDFHIIHLVTGKKGDAYRLFTIINDRGRSLHVGDLLRALTLELLESSIDKQADIEQRWQKILGGKQTEIEKFFQDYYVSYKGQRAPTRDFYDFFRKEFFNFSNPPKIGEVDKIFSQVVKINVANDYHNQLMNGEWPYPESNVEDWDKNRLFLLTKILRHTLCIPLLLTAREKLDEGKFLQIVLLLDRVVIRYINIMHNRPNNLEKLYLRYSALIRKNPTKFKINDLKSDLHLLLTNDAPDRDFIDKLNILEYSKGDSKNNLLIRYLLSTINADFSWYNRGAQGNPKPEKMLTLNILNSSSIEHIYPRTSATIDASLEPNKNKLGNLTLWGPRENSKVGNDQFLQKKQKYSQSQLFLNQEISKLQSWDITAFNQRNTRIIDRIVKSFNV